jgi:hypothetical protein
MILSLRLTTQVSVRHAGEPAGFTCGVSRSICGEFAGLFCSRLNLPIHATFSTYRSVIPAPQSFPRMGVSENGNLHAASAMSAC